MIIAPPGWLSWLAAACPAPADAGGTAGARRRERRWLCLRGVLLHPASHPAHPHSQLLSLESHLLPPKRFLCFPREGKSTSPAALQMASARVWMSPAEHGVMEPSMPKSPSCKPLATLLLQHCPSAWVESGPGGGGQPSPSSPISCWGTCVAFTYLFSASD